MFRHYKSFDVTNCKPVVYLKHDPNATLQWYVGSTWSLTSRYSPRDRESILMKNLASRDDRERHKQEQEFLEFCQAFGLPLSNKQRAYIHYGYFN